MFTENKGIIKKKGVAGIAFIKAIRIIFNKKAMLLIKNHLKYARNKIKITTQNTFKK